MEVTDADIKLARTSAAITEALQACQDVLQAISQLQHQLQRTRQHAEEWFGDLVAQKLMVDQHRKI